MRFDPVRATEYLASPLHYTFNRDGSTSGQQFVFDNRFDTDGQGLVTIAPTTQPLAIERHTSGRGWGSSSRAGSVYCAASMQLPEGRVARIGVIFMGTSLALWVVLPVVPFLSMEAGAKATLAGGQIVFAEVIFWLGAAMAGPEAPRRMRTWRRPKPDPATASFPADGGGEP